MLNTHLMLALCSTCAGHIVPQTEWFYVRQAALHRWNRVLC